MIAATMLRHVTELQLLKGRGLRLLCRFLAEWSSVRSNAVRGRAILDKRMKVQQH